MYWKQWFEACIPSTFVGHSRLRCFKFQKVAGGETVRMWCREDMQTSKKEVPDVWQPDEGFDIFPKGYAPKESLRLLPYKNISTLGVRTSLKKIKGYFKAEEIDQWMTYLDNIDENCQACSTCSDLRKQLHSVRSSKADPDDVRRAKANKRSKFQKKLNEHVKDNGSVHQVTTMSDSGPSSKVSPLQLPNSHRLEVILNSAHHLKTMGWFFKTIACV